MAEKWTKEQEKAITGRGHNMLVAAAAGSGKTAVMVERIIRMIRDDGMDIDNMLIVTFTNAAAAEMKEKIRKALKEASFSKPELKEQLAKLPGANISTFHSFEMSVIRRYFYKSDVQASYRISDEAEAKVLKSEAMDRLLEELYEEYSPEFLRFLDRYGSEKSDDNIRNIISDTYNSLMAVPHPFTYLEAKLNEMENLGSDFIYSDTMKYFWDSVKRLAYIAYENIKKACDLLSEYKLSKLHDKACVFLSGLVGLKDALDEGKYSSVEKYLDIISWERMAASKDEKDTWSSIKDKVSAHIDFAKSCVNKLRTDFFAESIDSQIEELMKTLPEYRTLVSMLKRFHEIFSEIKRDKNLLDFNDIEQYAVNILDDPEVYGYYRNRFKAIFIDEYQDTSLLQESVITSISSGSNLFMVGDIKQSIYKFRLAEPEIFKNKYEQYSEECTDSVKIDLNKNFRSKASILDAINNVFEGLMDNYDDNAKLYAGLDSGENALSENQFEPELVLLDKGDKSESGSEADDIIAEAKDAELEGEMIAGLIKENLGSEIYDSKMGKKRRMSYGDMVILMRAMTDAGSITDVLSRHGIPTYMESSGEYFDQVEINLMIDLLRICDNRYQDIPLIGVLRSPIFEFTVDELAEIRVRRGPSGYAEAFESSACGLRYSPEDDYTTPKEYRDSLSEKCLNAKKRIEKWKMLSVTMTLAEFVWHIMIDSNYYVLCGAMPNGSQRQANLRTLVEKAQNYQSNSRNSLYGFIKYVEAVKKGKIQNGQVKLISEDANVVRIMTIHKSKGLEYPMVIVARMGKQLNYDKAGAGIFFHKDIGIGMKLKDVEMHTSKNTLFYNIISAKKRQEAEEEELRVLYVALTRAKDKLFMTGVLSRKKDSVSAIDDYIENKSNGIGTTTSYLSMLRTLPTLRRYDSPEMLYGRVHETEAGKETYTEDALSEADREEVKRRLKYQYPYAEDTNIKAKWSVSALNHEAYDEAPELADFDEEKPDGINVSSMSDNFALPKFMESERVIGGAERGTLYHSFMEKLDFARALSEGIFYVNERKAELVSKGFFTEEEAEAVRNDLAFSFFESDLGKRAAKAQLNGKLWKEKSFDLIYNHEGHEIITQGIIDCFFEEDGELVLLDYKTNGIDFNKDIYEEYERLKNLYRTQLRIYKQAIEEGTGLKVKESYLYLVKAKKAVVIN